jgi:uncharacterized protein YbbK (DUF523 family)/uncharacterized protein YbgA (DUF1722 family)
MFIKPKILLSKCIELESCRFNGQFISDDFVRELKKYVEIVPICPEVAIGLGIPRDPVSIYEDKETKKRFLIQKRTEKNLTKEIEDFSKNFVNSIKDIDGAILKSKSPSCGLKDARIRDLETEMPISNSSGFFAKEVINKFSHLVLEDEKRLTNSKIREDFLIKLFLFARLRETVNKNNYSSLEVFHRKNKFIIMMYSQINLKKLGNILANHDKRNILDLNKNYLNLFYKTFQRQPKKSNIVNTLNHIYGYFKKNLSTDEKNFFFNNLELYIDDRIPLISIIYLLKSWAIRFKENYILEQYFFDPYPRELDLYKTNFK